jgi:hypothetical protein
MSIVFCLQRIFIVFYLMYEEIFEEESKLVEKLF